MRENAGGVPLVCVHGWPETKRVFWKVIQPLADAGFEVIVPDLRGFGDSDVGPDGFHDVPSHARDLYALVHDHLGHERSWCSVATWAGRSSRTSPCAIPSGSTGWCCSTRRCRTCRTRCAASPARARRARRPTTSCARAWMPMRWPPSWPHPTSAAGTSPPSTPAGSGRIPGRSRPDEVDFHTEPFADGAKLRASFGGYESVFHESARSEPGAWPNPTTRTLLLHGTSDHVIYPAYDRMAAVVFPNHVGPFLLRDCGHFVPWEAPHALASGTVAFCGDLLARPDGV